MKKKIGVYICHCGGNISDYVDVAQLGKLVSGEENVVISKDVMFACADSNQKQMIQDIKDHQLDAIVVASCSPKLHLHTFRNVAQRAGLNPYHYTQVNIREQCSWAHSDTPAEATTKAYGLIRAGINRVSFSEALENIEINTKRAVAVIGAGVAGMRAAIDLARMGNEVYLIEKENQPGGHIAQAGKLFMTGETGKEMIERLLNQLQTIPQIKLFRGATVEKISGNIGNFMLEVHIGSEILKLNIGSVLVTTGFDFYHPKEGEYGFAMSDKVITLDKLNRMIMEQENKLMHNNKEIKNIAYIYCVGNRQTKGENKYCSRFCCTAAIYSSVNLHEKFKGIKTYHLYRDIRTYGKQELLYEKSSGLGDVYIRYEEKEPPVVAFSGEKPVIKVKDYLTLKIELTLEPDLIVLVNGMVPRSDSSVISEKLKIPVGNDRFFNEIHPKLKPVETVIKGIFIGGACQGPKNISESVQSSLSGAAKINALIKSGTIALEPIVARINTDVCSWCGKCTEVCEYDAIKPLAHNGKTIAEVNPATCKGCGICAPVCPADAIDLAQFTNHEIESMIDGFAETIDIKSDVASAEIITEETGIKLKEYPQLWKNIIDKLEEQPMAIPDIAQQSGMDKSLITYHLMTMNRYGIVEPVGLNEEETYFIYKLKK